MSDTSPEVQWRCSCCGTENGAPFGNQGFTCAACGANEIAEGNHYKTIIESNFNTFPKIFWDKPFSEISAEQTMCVWVTRVCPQFAGKQIWKDCTLFDLCWIFSANVDVAWSLPLEQLPETVWEALKPFQHFPAFAVKHFLATRSVKWLQEACTDETFGSVVLRRVVSQFLEQPWSKTDTFARDDVVAFLASQPNAILKSLVPALPVDMKLGLWLRCQEEVVPATEVFRQVDGETVIKYLKDNRYARIVSLHCDFSRLSSADWKELLPDVVTSAITDRFCAALAAQWTVLHLPHKTVLDIITQNPDAERFLPFKHFSPDCFLFLLTHTDAIAWDIVAHCDFTLFKPRHWRVILMNEHLLDSTSIKQAITACDVIAKLSPEQRLQILDANPHALVHFAVADLPLEKAVSLYLGLPDLAFKDETAFLKCPNPLKILLLSQCGKHVPSVIEKMLDDKSLQYFTAEEVEYLLSKNPVLAKFIPESHLATLPAEVFLRLLVHQDSLESWDVTAHCPFTKFDKTHWKTLLSDPRIQQTPKIVEIFKTHHISNLFNREERLEIIESNPSSAIHFDASDLPLHQAVEFYLSHPKTPFRDDTIFLNCSRALAMQLLKKCGTHIPSVATSMLRRDSHYAFTAKEIVELLTKNPALALHLSDDRIASLPPSLFLSLANQIKGAPYWIECYDLTRLPRTYQIALVRLAPWALERMNLKEWSNHDLKTIHKALPWAHLSTQQKICYFLYRKTFDLIVFVIFLICIILEFFL